MADNMQNQGGMPNPNDDMANRQPQQSGSGQGQGQGQGQPGTFTGGSGGQAGNSQAGSSEQQGGEYASRGQDQQFDSSAGQSGGSYGSDTSLTDQVREHMTVVGPDGQTVGKVDSVDGGRIKLTRNDSADGQHHYLDASQIDGIEGDRIRLSQAPDWGNDSGESSRAM
jgi:hypothetical protein